MDLGQLLPLVGRALTTVASDPYISGSSQGALLVCLLLIGVVACFSCCAGCLVGWVLRGALQSPVKALLRAVAFVNRATDRPRGYRFD